MRASRSRTRLAAAGLVVIALGAFGLTLVVVGPDGEPVATGERPGRSLGPADPYEAAITQSHVGCVGPCEVCIAARPAPATPDATTPDARTPDATPTPDAAANSSAGADEPETFVPLGPPVPGEIHEAWRASIDVTDDAGEPVDGARVRLWAPRRAGGKLLADLRTAKGGRAAIPAMLQASDPEVVALVEAQGTRGCLLRVQTAIGGRALLSRLDGERDPLVAAGRGETGEDEPDLDDVAQGLLVQVRGDGEPLVGAAVRLRLDALTVVEARTGETGAAILQLPSSASDLGLPGQATGLVVEASAEGWTPARVAARGGAVTLALRRGPPGAVAGRVVDGQGLPVVGAVVAALVVEGTTSGRAATDADGRFLLEGLAPGRTTLEVWSAGDLPDATGSAFVEAGRTATTDLVVRGRAVVEVRVVEGGLPAGGVEVKAVDPLVTRYGSFEASGGQRSGRTDAEGRLQLELPPGGWHLRATQLDREATASVQVAPGGRTAALLDLSAGRTLAIRAVKPDGTPVPSVFMDVSMPGFAWSGMPSARTDAQGWARFPDLPPGRAEVHVGDRQGQWRMVRTAADEATIVLTPPRTIRARLRLTSGLGGGFGGEGEAVALVTVLDDVAVLHPGGHEDRERPGFERERDPDGVDAAVFATPAPDGPAVVYLVSRDPGLGVAAVAPLGAGELTGDGLACEVRFEAAATLRGRLVGRDGLPRAGVVRLGGALGGAIAARTQWLSDTANDRWVTCNEWSVGTGPDGAFELRGLPPGRATLVVEPIGARPSTVEVTVGPDQTLDLGPLGVE